MTMTMTMTMTVKNRPRVPNPPSRTHRFGRLLILMMIGCHGQPPAGKPPTSEMPPDLSPCPDGSPYLACGEDCTETADCPDGSFCGPFAQCVAECWSTTEHCAPTETCTTHGRCALTVPDAKQNVCAAKVVETTFTIPTVILLIDQSGSMTSSYSGGTRWGVLENALTDPQDGVIARLESSVRFGLTLYTGGATCPDLTQVPPALNNYDAIEPVYSAAAPKSETPTGESIDAVVADLLPYPEPGPKFIVLATDGEPDTCAQPNPQEGQPESLAAAQNSHAKGIDLFILSVGQGAVSLQHLQEMANAGIGLPLNGSGGNAPYYEPNNQAELATAFDQIIGRVMSCVLTVNGTIDPSVTDRGVVYLDGDPVPYDDPDGWVYVDESTIQLVGAACDQVKSGGDHVVTVSFPCEGEDPV